MTGKAFAAAAAAAVALLAAGSAQPRPGVPAKGGLPLLGIVSDSPNESLVRVHPYRLRALPGKRVDVGSANGWAFSPDRRLLAIGRWVGVGEDSYGDAKGFIRIVDPYAMSVVADIPLGPEPPLGSWMAWLAPDRIVTLTWNCCSNDVDVVVTDPFAGRVVERRAIGLEPIRAVRSGNRLVVLAAELRGIAPVRLLLIDADGQVETVALDRIDGGHERIGEGQDVGVNDVRPALVVEPDGRRAFVFSPSGLAAEVDLSSLAVTYHPLARDRLAPAVRPKRFMGSSRWAQVLPNGLVALTGSTTSPYMDTSGNEQIRREPAGLELVDTRDWTVRIIDAAADSFAFASDRLLTRDLLLATGSRWDSGTNDVAGSGLRAYTLDGERTFRLFKGREAFVDRVYGIRAFVSVYEPGTLRVVNLGTGRVVGSRDYETVPWLITP